MRLSQAILKHRRLLLLLFLSLAFSNGFGQSPKFIKNFKPLADSLSEEYGIPASVILGISIIESGSGTSRNCKLLNNYFGISIARLPAIPGILGYQRDKVIDLKAAPAPGVAAQP